MSVYRCDGCQTWCDGAAFRPSDAPRDRYGRIDRDFTGPRYCNALCRDHAEGTCDPIRCTSCLASRAVKATARRTAARKGASRRG